MAQILVRGLEDELKSRLQRRASRNGQSMEAEARDILRDALKEDEPRDGLGTRISAHFRKIGLERHEAIEELRSGDLRDPFET